MSRAWPLTARGTGAVILALVCFVSAAQTGIVQLTYFAVLLLVAVGTSLISLRLTHRAGSLSRTLDPPVSAVGQSQSVTVATVLRSAIPTSPGQWRDTLPDGLRGSSHGTFPALPSELRRSDRVIEVHYPATAVTRGIHRLDDFRVTFIDPFGFARRVTRFSERTEVVVAPAVVDLPPHGDSGGSTGGVLHVASAQLGQGSDNLIARPYVPGDSMRRIHWRATAHRDHLMVRQEEQESTPEALVVLDRSALRWSIDATRAPGVDESFEIAVSACASVIARFVQDGYRVEVIDAEGTALHDPIEAGDGTEVDEMLRQFATLVARPGDALPSLPARFAHAACGPVVLIVGTFDHADAALIAPIAHHSTMPVLLTVLPQPGALERAGDSAWRASAIHDDGDLAAAWTNATGRGASFVHA